MAKRKAQPSSTKSSKLDVDISEQAREFLRQLPREESKAIGRAIDRYQTERSGNVRALSGKRGWLRLRQGNVRVVFKLEDGTMKIPLIADRAEVYKALKRLNLA